MIFPPPLRHAPTVTERDELHVSSSDDGTETLRYEVYFIYSICSISFISQVLICFASAYAYNSVQSIYYQNEIKWINILFSLRWCESESFSLQQRAIIGRKLYSAHQSVKMKAVEKFSSKQLPKLSNLQKPETPGTGRKRNKTG